MLFVKALIASAKYFRVVLLYLAAATAVNAEIYVIDAPSDTKNFVPFRDAQRPNFFYFLPAVYSLSSAGSEQKRLGVQIFSDAKNSSLVNGAVTLSLYAAPPAAGGIDLRTWLIQRYGVADPKISPPARTTSRISIFSAGVQPLATTKWSSSSADSTQSISFTISNVSKSDLKRLLSGENGGISVLVESQVENVVAGVVSAQIVDSIFVDLAKKRRFAYPGADLEEFIDKVLVSVALDVPVEKYLLRDSVSQWVRQRIGLPTILRSPGSAPRYGWDLSRILPAQDASLRVMKSLPRSEIVGFVLELGNVCQTQRMAILNIDDGSVGCDSL